MTDTALQAPPIEPAARSSRPDLNKGFNPLTLILFMGVMAAGLLYVVYSVYSDVEASDTKITTYTPYLMLLVALLIALGFDS
jgi:PiT family inorganic phosphate transporter